MASNQANELFELCKEVYERTGWERDDYAAENKTEKYERRYGKGIAYTSDYLLEKLPKFQEFASRDVFTKEVNNRTKTRLKLMPTDGSEWLAAYQSERGEYILVRYAENALQALLKLTLALFVGEENSNGI